MTKKSNVVDMIGSLLESIKMEKAAAEKGQTSHPSQSVDDGTVSAPEGERSSENVSDIKKEVGGTVGVAGQEDANSADQNTPADSIGTQSQASDEVKGNVPTPKAAPEKPGQDGQGDASPEHPTSHTFGEKYSSISSLGNKILAGLAVANAQPKKADAAVAPGTDVQVTVPSKEVKKEAKKKEAPKVEKKAEANLEKDAEAGYLAAKALYDVVMQKQASNADDTQAVIAPIVKAAQSDAQTFCEFMQGFEEGTKERSMNKTAAAVDQIGNALYQAADAGLLTPAMLKKAADDLSALTGQQVSPEELQAAMAGGGAPGGEMPPEAMGGGMPPEAMAGAGGDMGAEDPQIQAIAEELAQAGVTPEELIAAIQGAGGEGAPMGGEMGAPEGSPAVNAEAATEGEAPAQEAAEQKAPEKESPPEEEEEKEGAAKIAAIAGAAKKLLEKRKA